MAGKWSTRDLGHLRMILERNRAENVNAMAIVAHQTIKKRSVNAIGHKLRELISAKEFTASEIELEGENFPASLVSGYIIIKLPHGSLKSAHHYLWEKHYGVIPTGYDVHHIDGHRLNNTIKNLMLLTRDEHIKLHSKGKPPETALLFWFLQERNLWNDYLLYRETKIKLFE